MKPLARGLSWSIGDIAVTSVVELDLHWKIGRFLLGATPETVASMSWLAPYLDENPEWFPLRIQTLIVETPTKRILVDTCVGNGKERGFRDFDGLDTPFLDDMIAAGFEPGSIDIVLCTHLHLDHVGWNTQLVDGRWVPTFPNARHLFARVEYDHWMKADDDFTVSLLADSITPVVEAGLVHFVQLDHNVTEGVDLIPTTGHTPGHVSVQLTSGGETAVIIGDMTHHPIQIGRPAIASTADVDPDASTATRIERFAQWCEEGTLVIGTHFAPPTAGHLVTDGEAWRLT